MANLAIGEMAFALVLVVVVNVSTP